MADRLYRSRNDRPIGGVAGGVAAWLGLDPSLVRIAWVVLALVSGGIFLIVYIVMMVVVPLAPEGWQPRTAYDRYQGPTDQSGPAPDGSVPPPPHSWPEGWAQRQTGAPSDPGRAGLIAGLFLIALGGWFLVDDYIHIDWAVAWPMLVIIAGVALIVGAARRH